MRFFWRFCSHRRERKKIIIIVIGNNKNANFLSRKTGQNGILLSDKGTPFIQKHYHCIIIFHSSLRYVLVRENGWEPKNPLSAENGDG